MAFVKFMRNKFFHPHTFENQKRTWIAEQKHESEKKKQEDLHKQYIKEQAIYENKNLLKHGKLTQDDKLSFMYEPPLECRKKDDKLELREVRFEWQKNAPRAGEYAKNIEVTDRPFGIEVRNTKCIKCGVWGHMNTDKICPLYNQGLNTEENPPELGKEDPMSLLNSMERGGLKMRKHAVNAVMDVHDNKYRMLEDEKLDPEVAFIANLTDKQKRKLMRKLNKNNSGVGNVKKSKHKAKKNKKKKSKSNDEENTELPSDRITTVTDHKSEFRPPSSTDKYRSRQSRNNESSNESIGIAQDEKRDNRCHRPRSKSKSRSPTMRRLHNNPKRDDNSRRHDQPSSLTRTASGSKHRHGSSDNNSEYERQESPERKRIKCRNPKRDHDNSRRHDQSSSLTRTASGSKHRHGTSDNNSEYERPESPERKRIKYRNSDSVKRSKNQNKAESESKHDKRDKAMSKSKNHKSKSSDRATGRHDSTSDLDSSDDDNQACKKKPNKSKYETDLKTKDKTMSRNPKDKHHRKHKKGSKNSDSSE